MKNKRAKYIILLSILLLLGAGLYFGLHFYRGISENPMSAFDTPTPSPAASPTPVPTLSPDELERQAERELNEQADRDFMRNRVNILMLGWDQSPERDDEDSELYRDDANNFRSDVLMLLAVDFEASSVDLVSIPRDTLAKIYNTGGHWKINAAFAKGGSVNGDGFEYAIKTVENLMGVPIAYYAGVNMIGLKAVVDAMGGVDYDVDREITLNGRTLYTGQQHLNGQQVLDYCRARKGYGTDVDRADRQQRMLFAIFGQLQQNKKLTTLPKVYLSVKDYIHTNLTVEQIAALAVFGMELNVDTGLMRHTLEGKYISNTPYSGASFYVLDTAALKALMKDIFDADIEVDYRYDYRYVDGDKSAARGLEYADAAQYLCALTGFDISQYTASGGYYYASPDHAAIAEAAEALRALSTRVIPANASEEKTERLLQQPMDKAAIDEAVETLSDMLCGLCVARGVYREGVDKALLPDELYEQLPSYPQA